jgi:hypothetical protein
LIASQKASRPAHLHLKRAEVELNPIAMLNAARVGQTALRVKVPSNLDVNGTQTKATIEKWCKDEGLTLTWGVATSILRMAVATLSLNLK